MEAAKKIKDVAPGENQVLVTKDMAFTDVLKADNAGKYLVFDMLDFPEFSRTNLAKLSKRARAAYQMDLRNAEITKNRVSAGEEPFEHKIKVIGSKDPLSRNHSTFRKGQARKIPEGMKHLNVDPYDVEDLEQLGYRKAKPGEVIIEGAREKAGAVVLMNRKGDVDNVTMLVEEEKYAKHREADREKTQAKLNTNLESTKENMKQFAPRVTIYDKSELVRR